MSDELIMSNVSLFTERGACWITDLIPSQVVHILDQGCPPLSEAALRITDSPSPRNSRKGNLEHEAVPYCTIIRNIKYEDQPDYFNSPSTTLYSACGTGDAWVDYEYCRPRASVFSSRDEFPSYRPNARCVKDERYL